MVTSEDKPNANMHQNPEPLLTPHHSTLKLELRRKGQQPAADAARVTRQPPQGYSAESAESHGKAAVSLLKESVCVSLLVWGRVAPCSALGCFAFRIHHSGFESWRRVSTVLGSEICWIRVLIAARRLLALILFW